MKRDSYELSVKINGSKLPEYGSHGKTYIRGEVGREFTLHFRNNTADRVLARFSVDGLSVLDGKSAEKDSSGYLCDAYSSIEIAGWRTSLDEVRKFEFSTKGKSYAGKTTDSTTNCGVIGVQVYSEKQPEVKIVEKHIHHDHYPKYPKWPWAPWRDPYNPPSEPWRPTPMWGDDYICKDTSATYSSSTHKMSSSPLRSSNSMKKRSFGGGCSANVSSDEVTDYNLGTKFGESKNDSVRTVKFEIGSLITQLEIYYTDRNGLEKAGINLDKKTAIAAHPQAFGSFCQPPDED
jgi:hypothetical protein